MPSDRRVASIVAAGAAIAVTALLWQRRKRSINDVPATSDSTSHGAGPGRPQSGQTSAPNIPFVSDSEFVSRVKGVFFGCVVADALSLGTHYEYDAKKIRSFYGNIDQYFAPGEKTGGETHGIGWGGRNFHDGNGVGLAKRAGECTDYGDYNILMLEHLAGTSDPPHRVDLEELIPRWATALKTWRSWLCTQTRQTHQQVMKGESYAVLGGMSNAMALRCAAAYGYFDAEEDVAHAARTMMFTHREETALDGGEFFARVAFRIIHNNLSPRAAIESVAQQSSLFIKEKVAQALDKVAEVNDPSRPLSKEGHFVDDLALTSMARLWDIGRSEPIKVGKASPTEGVLPGSVYFIVKYGDLFKAAQANAMVGGDSASRAVAIGMVLGAAKGVESIPQQLRDTFVGWERLDGLLNSLPLIVQKAKTKGLALQTSQQLQGGLAKPMQPKTPPSPERDASKKAGPVQRHIQEVVSEALCPQHLDVTNESHGQHSDESHFHVVVVSSKFDGLTRINRSRLVTELFTDERGALKFHALRVTAKTPAQWATDQKVPVAPACTGRGDGRGPTDSARM